MMVSEMLMLKGLLKRFQSEMNDKCKYADGLMRQQWNQSKDDVIEACGDIYMFEDIEHEGVPEIKRQAI